MIGPLRLIGWVGLLALVLPAAAGLAQDISVTKDKVGASDVTVGERFSYTVTVANNDPLVQAFSVVMTDTLPPELSFVSISPSINCSGTTTITCNEGILFPGFPVIYTITVDLVGGTPGTSITNTASITQIQSVESPPDPTGNNSDSAVVTIPGADLTIDKSHAGAAVRDQQISYNVVVTNLGPAATVGTTTVTDTLPVGLNPVSISGGAGWTCTTATLSCDFPGVIPSGSSPPPITVTAFIASDAPDTVINTATVTVGNDSNAGNNTAQDQTAITSSPDVNVFKFGPATVAAGETIAYTIDAGNAGLLPATNIVLTDTLPPEITFVSLTAPPGWTCSTPAVGANGTITCTLPTLAPRGGIERFTLVGRVDAAAAGDITNFATISSASPDIDPTNNTFGATTAVTQVSDLALDKSHTGNGVRGQQLTYTLEVTNVGASVSAGTTTLSDTLPAGLTAISMAGTGWTCDVGTLTCTTTAAVAPGGGAFPPVTLVVEVEQSASAIVTNTATVSNALDLNAANNTDTDPTAIESAGVNGALSLELGFSQPTYFSVGQVIEVRYLVTNTGTQPVTNIVVADPKVPVITCPQTTLVPDESMTCTGTYTIVAGDITTGVSPFTATATGNPGASATASGAITLLLVEIGKDFVETRARLLDPNPPGLHDRIGTVTANLSEGNGDATFSFAGSFLGGAGDAAAALAGGGAAQPFKFWIDGELTLHSRDNGGGGFAMVGLGADYLVNENVLLGAALYIDWMSDTTAIGDIAGRGYLIGPYVSIGLTPALTFDAALFYGGSNNDVDVTIGGVPLTGTFTTERWLARARLDGMFGIGNVVVRPDATLFYLSETTGAYTVRDALGNPVGAAGFVVNMLDLSGGVRIERPIELESGLTLIPRAGLRLGLEGGGATIALSDPYGTASLGFVLEGDNWKFDSSIEGSLWASSLKALRYKAGIAGEF